MLSFIKIKTELSFIKCLVIMANVRPFRALRKVSDEERARALGPLEAGIHQENVANQFNVHRSTIFRLRQCHRATGTVSDRPRSERPKCTTEREDRYIAVTVARRRFVDGPVLRECWDSNEDQGHVPSRCRQSGIEFESRGLRPKDRLRSPSSLNATEL